jgi:DNA repair protein RecO (recombination protein O)
MQPAFVLHLRAWRETSGIVELLTSEHGRISLVARGMRRSRPGLSGILQPFQPVMVSWSGRGGSLMTLRNAESMGPPFQLAGTALISGFYLNELVLRFLHRGDPHPVLFPAYGRALAELCDPGGPEPALRRFEMVLLAEAGYGLNLDHDADTGAPLEPAGRYRYLIERGPVAAGKHDGEGPTFSGADLLAIGRGDFASPAYLRGARLLLRMALDHHLGDRPLRTREVLLAMRC